MAVTFSRVGGNVLVATLTGPQNRLASRDLAELTGAVLNGDIDPSVGGLVIMGAGDDFFCSGGPRTASASVHTHWVHECGVGFPAHDKPIVAAVNGDALGGGFALVLGCDAAVATYGATLGSSLVADFANDDEMALGSLLTTRVGPQRTAELVYTGRRLTGLEALHEGLVDGLVRDVGNLLDAALALVRRPEGTARIEPSQD